MSASDGARAWERFWWREGSRRDLCLARALFGAAIVAKMIGLTGLYRLGAWDLGIPTHESAAMFLGGAHVFHMPVPGAAWLPALSATTWWWCEIAALLAALALTLGVFARAAAALLLAFYLYPLLYSQLDYYHHVFHLVAVLPVFACARADEHWSLRAALERATPPRPRPILPTRLLQMLTTWIYLSAWVGKTNHEWLSGGVLQAAAAEHQLRGALGEGLVAALSPAVLAWLAWTLEGLIPFVLWSAPTLALACGLALHLGIDATMHVESFSYQMLALYALFPRGRARSAGAR